MSSLGCVCVCVLTCIATETAMTFHGEEPKTWAKRAPQHKVGLNWNAIHAKGTKRHTVVNACAIILLSLNYVPCVCVCALVAVFRFLISCNKRMWVHASYEFCPWAQHVSVPHCKQSKDSLHQIKSCRAAQCRDQLCHTATRCHVVPLACSSEADGG